MSATSHPTTAGGERQTAALRTELQQESLTDGCDEPVEVAEGEERLRKFPEEQLEGAGDDVHVLPLAVLQVQLLCVGTQQGCTARQRAAGGAAAALRRGRGLNVPWSAL